MRACVAQWRLLVSVLSDLLAQLLVLLCVWLLQQVYVLLGGLDQLHGRFLAMAEDERHGDRRGERERRGQALARDGARSVAGGESWEQEQGGAGGEGAPRVADAKGGELWSAPAKTTRGEEADTHSGYRTGETQQAETHTKLSHCNSTTKKKTERRATNEEQAQTTEHQTQQQLEKMSCGPEQQKKFKNNREEPGLNR